MIEPTYIQPYYEVAGGVYMADLSSQPTPIQTVYNWYRNGLLFVNRKYQRKLV